MYIPSACGLASLTDSYINAVETSERKLHTEEFHSKFCHNKRIKEAGYFIGAFVKNATEEKDKVQIEKQTKGRILKTLA